MNRLVSRGSIMGAAIFIAGLISGTALADNPATTNTTATAAATPAPAATTAAAKPAAMPAKPATTAKPAKATAHKWLSLAKRKEIQTALNSHGASLKVDGRLGKQSREALKKFQSESGLKATGQSDKATLAKLGIK